MKLSHAKQHFTEIYQQTFHEAYGYILAKTGDIHATPDLLSKSYTAFLTHLIQSNEKENIPGRPHLFKIIRNRIAQYYRDYTDTPVEDPQKLTRKHQQLLEQELDFDIDIPTAKEEFQNKLDIIWPIITAKPLQMRRAFVLFYLFDFDLEQITKELNSTEYRIGNQIYELTKEIRQFLQKAE